MMQRELNRKPEEQQAIMREDDGLQALKSVHQTQPWALQ